MIWNFGSINIDHVYTLTNLPQPGETLAATDYARHLGGKGVNQSVAISKSGGDVTHVGAVGPDGDWARDQMTALGLGLDHVADVHEPTGNAVIYVDAAAENQIVILGGANQAISETQIEAVMAEADAGDWVLFQNEVNDGRAIAAAAKAAGLKIAYSAAPFDADIALPLLPYLDLLAVNEGEASALATAAGRAVEDLDVPHLLMTKGAEGAVYFDQGTTTEQNAFKVSPVDTTGAGDMFLGAFMARLSKGTDARAALRFAAAASAIQVTRAGAATAIPTEAEVMTLLDAQDG
ncbi:MAG: PfkB family carbohydrate kinase [Pseudomonadota bacterium]